MRALALLATLGALIAAPAAAADTSAIDARATPAYQTCVDRIEGQTNTGANQCISVELKIQDVALNEAYRNLMAQLTPNQKVGLQKAQRAWIAFRDADCASRYSPDWGDYSSVTANRCVLERTIERTIDLERFSADWLDSADEYDADELPG